MFVRLETISILNEKDHQTDSFPILVLSLSPSPPFSKAPVLCTTGNSFDRNVTILKRYRGGGRKLLSSYILLNENSLNNALKTCKAISQDVVSG